MSAALDWTDRAACAAWFADVAGRCKDVVAVAEDQTLPIGKRRLGRATALRLLAEGKGALLAQLRYARAGLTVGEVWIRVNVTDDTRDGRRRVWLVEASGARHASYVPLADIDGDRVRAALLKEDGDRVTVLIPSTIPVRGGVPVTVHRGEVFPSPKGRP